MQILAVKILDELQRQPGVFGDGPHQAGHRLQTQLPAGGEPPFARQDAITPQRNALDDERLNDLSGADPGPVRGRSTARRPGAVHPGTPDRTSIARCPWTAGRGDLSKRWP
jgi:hypothetical protein